MHRNACPAPICNSCQDSASGDAGRYVENHPVCSSHAVRIMRYLVLAAFSMCIVGCVHTSQWCEPDSLNVIGLIPEDDGAVTVDLTYSRDGYVPGSSSIETQADRIVLKVKPLDPNYGKSLGRYRIANPDDLPIVLSDGMETRQIYPEPSNAR